MGATLPPVLPPTSTPAPADDIPNGSVKRSGLGIVAACVAVFLVSVWPTVAHPLVFSNDGPQHLLQGYVHAHYADPRYGFDSVFALNEPLTARGYLDLFRWLEPALGWRRAHQTILLFAEFLWCSAWAALALRLHRRRWPVALLGCATGIQWAYWVGFLPFFLGLGASLWSFHIVLTRPRPWHYVLLSAALLICCQIHVFPVVVAGFALFCVGVARGRGHAFATILAGLPSVAFNQYLSSISSQQQPTAVWNNPVDPVRALVGRFFGGDLATGVALLSLAVFALFAGWRARGATSRAMLVGGVTLMLCAYAAPHEVRGWELVGPRFLPFAHALLFCSIPLENIAARIRNAVVVTIAFVVLGHAAWAASFHERLDQDSASVVALARQLPPQTGRVWGLLVADGEVDSPEGVDFEGTRPANLNAWLHLAQVLALDLGGAPLYTQSSDETIHGVLAPEVPLAAESVPGGNWASTWPTIDDGRRRQNITGILNGLSRSTRHVVYVGRVGDEPILAESGFDITASVTDGERIAVAAVFRSCTVKVVVPPDASVVESGAFPWLEADVARVPDVEGVVEFERVGCGSRWVRVDGTPCGGSSADPARRARALFTDGALLICRPDN